MNENLYDDQFDQSEESFDILALLFRYLNYWYYFVASVLILVAAMFLYLKTVTPTYEVNASVIIEDDKGKSGSNPMMNLESLGFVTATSGFDNELELLQSRTLIKNTVISEGLYISYEKKGLFRNEDLYKKSPVQVWVSPEEALKLQGGAKMEIKVLSETAYDVTITIADSEGVEVEYNKTFNKLPAVFTTPSVTFSLTHGVGETVAEWTPEDILLVSVSNPIAVAKGYTASLTIAASSKTTTIANIALKNSNKSRGVDFINKLVELYNKETNDYKNQVALKTSEFINARIEIINRELGATEEELEAFKKQAGITDLQSDAQIALSENSAYKQRIVENNTQLRLVQFLKDYATNPESEYEVLPINVGLSDAGLAQLIAGYNEMLLERKRLLITSSESNPAVVTLDASISSMRTNVLTTINSVEKGLLITQTDIEKEAELYAGRISSAPTQEREFITIARQQEIQSTLYLLLLEKREENALTLASTANNARIFNEPLATTAPVAPNKKMYMLIALVLGLGIPMGVVYLKDLFSFKIEGRSDVEKITKIPVLADIPTYTDKPDDSSIVVQENKNDLMAESFRALRTNMLFTMKEGQKVALITSTCTGEGKSFISSNLAVSLALMGKKVIIVGLDIRKPGLNKTFNMSGKLEGISNYLSKPSTDLMSLIQPSGISPNLSILFGGTIPPNPTELLSRDTLDKAIEILKEKYDYVILDTAPIGMVTDTQIISRVADASIYVCRANFSNKSDYRYINELHHMNKVPNLSTVINDVDLRKRRYGYYGYGNRYGYGNKYGYGGQYGYGYGYEQEDKK